MDDIDTSQYYVIQISEYNAMKTEIELLREVAEAANECDHVAFNPKKCRLCRALKAWEEARCG